MLLRYFSLFTGRGFCQDVLPSFPLGDSGLTRHCLFFPTQRASPTTNNIHSTPQRQSFVTASLCDQHSQNADSIPYSIRGAPCMSLPSLLVACRAFSRAHSQPALHGPTLGGIGGWGFKRMGGWFGPGKECSPPPRGSQSESMFSGAGIPPTIPPLAFFRVASCFF